MVCWRSLLFSMLLLGGSTAKAVEYLVHRKNVPGCDQIVRHAAQFLFLKGEYPLGPWTVSARQEFERNIGRFPSHFVNIHTDYFAEGVFARFRAFEDRPFRLGSVDPKLELPKCQLSQFQAVCFEERAMRSTITLPNDLSLRVAQKETLDMEGNRLGHSVTFKLFSKRLHGFQMRLKSVLQTDGVQSADELAAMTRLFLVNSGNVDSESAQKLPIVFERASSARRMSIDVYNRKGEKVGFVMFDKKAYSDKQHFAPFRNNAFSVEAEYVGLHPDAELSDFAKYVSQIEDFLRSTF